MVAKRGGSQTLVCHCNESAVTVQGKIVLKERPSQKDVTSNLMRSAMLGTARKERKNFRQRVLEWTGQGGGGGERIDPSPRGG